MNVRYIIGAFLVLMVLLITAGCTQTTPPATPVPTPIETIATAVPTPIPTALSLTPGPTQMLPDVWSLEVQAQGNGEAINPLIIVSLPGRKRAELYPAHRCTGNPT